MSPPGSAPSGQRDDRRRSERRGDPGKAAGRRYRTRSVSMSMLSEMETFSLNEMREGKDMMTMHKCHTGTDVVDETSKFDQMGNNTKFVSITDKPNQGHPVWRRGSRSTGSSRKRCDSDSAGSTSGRRKEVGKEGSRADSSTAQKRIERKGTEQLSSKRQSHLHDLAARDHARRELLRDYKQLADGRYHCHKCDLFYKNAKGMETHVLYSLKHDPENEKRWKKCELCKQKFHPTSLNKHMVEVHGVGTRLSRRKRKMSGDGRAEGDRKRKAPPKSARATSSRAADPSPSRGATRESSTANRKLQERPREQKPSVRNPDRESSVSAGHVHQQSAIVLPDFHFPEYGLESDHSIGYVPDDGSMGPSIEIGHFESPVATIVDNLSQNVMDELLQRTANDHILPHNMWSDTDSGAEQTFSIDHTDANMRDPMDSLFHTQTRVHWDSPAQLGRSGPILEAGQTPNHNVMVDDNRDSSHGRSTGIYHAPTNDGTRQNPQTSPFNVNKYFRQ